MEIEREEDGSLWLSGISPLHADTLMNVPSLLQSEDSRVRGRLFPPGYEDDDEQEQWCRYTTPELEHLFSSRAKIVNLDLKSLAHDGELTFTLRIQQAHATAWLSALNGARLALFALHEFEQEDMEADPADLDDFEKELALVRIHLMAFMQELLIEAGV